MRIAGGTAAVLTLAVVLAGCGSKYTRADFRARANAICATAVRRARALAPPAATGTSRREQLKALSAYLARLVPVVQAEATQLRQLKTPPGTAGEQAALKRYLAGETQAAAAYRQLEAAAKRGDSAGVAGAEATLRASPVVARALANGLRSCGNPGGTVA